jgi:hypothetical protein
MAVYPSGARYCVVDLAGVAGYLGIQAGRQQALTALYYLLYRLGTNVPELHFTVSVIVYSAGQFCSSCWHIALKIFASLAEFYFSVSVIVYCAGQFCPSFWHIALKIFGCKLSFTLLEV